MYHQSTFSPRTMVHVTGSYQANGQYHPVQNHTYYTNSPSNMRQEFIHYNRNASNHNRQRVTQGSHQLELLHRYHLGTQTANYGIPISGNSANWAAMRMSSPNNAPTTPQRTNGSNGLSVTPVLSYRPMSAGSVKKHAWNNNKLGKRHSYQDLPLPKESGNNSDSGVDSRSPTPNKHHKGGSQVESSDERDSITSTSESRLKNKSSRQNNYRGHLVTSLSTGNLHQDQQQSNEFAELASIQNYQNRRKFPAARVNTTTQRPQRGKKFTGSGVPHISYRKFCPPSPADRFLEKAHLILSEQQPSNLETDSNYDKLSKAMWKKFEENKLSHNTYCHKMYLWRFLFFFIKSKFPNYELFMVGSTLNGFGSDTSDVDMCLFINDPAMGQRGAEISCLIQIMSCLRRSDYIHHLELIQAKVPILKVRDNVYNLDVDLNVNNIVGVRNTHLLYCYSQIDWRVRPLVLVVKMWAQSQNINDARHMTISSYSLVLMVIHFLQCGVTPAVLPCLHKIFKNKFNPHSDITKIDIHEELNIEDHVLQPRNTQSLGELLIEFFKYYNSFKFNEQAISVREAGTIPVDQCRYFQSLKNDPTQWKYLCIEEPFDFSNTARSVYDAAIFDMIKNFFKQAYEQLKMTNDLDSIFTSMRPSN